MRASSRGSRTRTDLASFRIGGPVTACSRSSTSTAPARVPYGELTTYKVVARQAGNEQASRAAGAALGANPIPIVVPCHRIVATDGTLGGYAGGLVAKRRLLALERGKTEVPLGGWPPSRR